MPGYCHKSERKTLQEMKPKRKNAKALKINKKKIVSSGKSKTKKQLKNNRIKNANTNGFSKNKQNINRKGRPRKLVSTIIDELRTKGIEGVKAAQVIDAYEAMFNLTRKELTEKASDEEAPIFIRIVAREMLSGKGPEMLERMMDRAHGKAKQVMDHTTNGKDLNIPFVSWTGTQKG